MSAQEITGVALVTGAASGIGRETAFTFAEAGASAIVFADLNAAQAQAAATQSREFATNPAYQAVALRIDTTKPELVNEVVARTVKEFGRIDYLINSAGISLAEYTPFKDASIEDFDTNMNVNARGAFLCAQAVAKVMCAQETRTVTTRRHGTKDIGRGSIVNVGSALGYGAVPGKVGYIAAKHALLGITKSAALDNAALGIRVNAVCPTWVKTAMFELETSKTPPIKDFIKASVPLGRPAEPEEVADVIKFLCSPAASYVNGTGLIIDAGFTLTAHTG